jgi:pentose-5-phosphate-3-epimerase
MPTVADPLLIIKSIHDRKMKAGVAISPDTPSASITDEIAQAADMLLVMTVYPGTWQRRQAILNRSFSQAAAVRNFWKDVYPKFQSFEHVSRTRTLRSMAALDPTRSASVLTQARTSIPLN